MDGKKPLWLPEGSVRALLALFVTGVVFGRIAVGAPVTDTELAVASGVLASYGVYRIVAGKPDR